MSRPDRHALLLAAILALLASCVDALGYLTLGSFFVSFMSGNSTRFSIALATGDQRMLATAGSLIALFVLGVVVAVLVAPEGPGRQRRMLLLVAAMALGGKGGVLRLAGPVHVTYVTGTLVKMGRELAGMPRGRSRRSLLPCAPQ